MVDYQEDNALVRAEAAEHWNQARRRAFLERFYGALGLSRRSTELLSFEDVSQKLRLAQSAYRGLQQVPLDQIVGSVGRYNDFTRTFLPLIEDDSWRWRRIAELQSVSGLPPIELYKVGDAYFVKDGNHRVSVARQFGMDSIEAYVWEYETPVGGLSATPEVDDLIVKVEYRAFLDRTRLDVSHPDQEINVTEPGMYPYLEVEIEIYRDKLLQIDEEDRTYEEAASAWYELVYTPAVQVIEQSGILKQFPGRTASDLFVWVSRHRAELAERYGERVSLRDAVDRLAEKQQAPGTVSRVMQSVASSVAGLMQGLAHEPARPVPQEEEEPVVAPSEDEPLGKLLAVVDAYQPEMGYSGQRGDQWRGWRFALRDKLRELLGMQYAPAESVPVEMLERDLIDGVERTRIILEAADGLRLPGYVMRPVDLKEKAPALLILPGHGTARQVAGVDPSPQRGNGLALAQAGYVTVTFEERGFGELGQVDHLALDNLAQLVGHTWIGLIVDDALRVVDYVQSRPDVKPTHIGVTGLGLGGGLAMFAAALDERIRAVVIQNYSGIFSDVLEHVAHGCDYIPNLRRYARPSDIARLIVPRPALYAYPRGRRATQLARAEFDEMRPLYEIFRCPDRTRFVEHSQKEAFDTQLAAQWFYRWLQDEEDTSVLLWAPYE